ncbi:DNA-3-methyladenine glycosylase 2 family protein [Candidatus Collierbacteria bacterium]|nr:DNA-3-methyladenine glycosylase 2 family protein [Candidatus Collierbacteria bacterium]
MRKNTSTELFKNDPVMRKLIAKHQIKEYYGGQNNYFLDLVEIVIGQQLSMKAADSILKRFLGIFPVKPKPDDVLNLPADKLRAVGLSNSKANYVKNIASAISPGAIILDQLEKLTDDEIKKELIKIKGIGPWSVEMFLIFSLKRPDVFSVGDLGLRTAIEKLYGISRNDQKAILALAQTWHPHRSLASRLLWASLDNI